MNKGAQDFKRVHFLLLWYPDGVYQLKAYVYDCWSPVGMLSRTADLSQIKVDGNMYNKRMNKQDLNVGDALARPAV